MKMCLGPKVVAFDGSKTLLNEIKISTGRKRTVEVRLVRRSASSRLVHYVDSVAFTQEKLRPPFAAIGRACEIGSRLATPVNHDDGIGMRHLGWALELGVQLICHHFPVFN